MAAILDDGCTVDCQFDHEVQCDAHVDVHRYEGYYDDCGADVSQQDCAAEAVGEAAASVQEPEKATTAETALADWNAVNGQASGSGASDAAASKLAEFDAMFGTGPAAGAGDADALAPVGNTQMMTLADIFNGDPAIVLNGLTADDIAQGSSNNCWWLSALSAMAENNPEVLERALHHVQYYEEGGVFHVQLYNAETQQWEIIQVEDSFAWGKTVDPNGAEAWVMIMEAAMAKMRHGDQHYLTTGGYMADGLLALTGDMGTTYNVDPNNPLHSDYSNGDWFADATRADRNGGTVLASTWGTLPQEAQEQGLVQGHAYSVRATFTGDDGSQWVQLRNPWGDTEWEGDQLFDDVDDGTFWISKGQFDKYFDSVCVQGPTAA